MLQRGGFVRQTHTVIPKDLHRPSFKAAVYIGNSRWVANPFLPRHFYVLRSLRTCAPLSSKSNPFKSLKFTLIFDAATLIGWARLPPKPSLCKYLAPQDLVAPTGNTVAIFLVVVWFYVICSTTNLGQFDFMSFVLQPTSVIKMTVRFFHNITIIHP